MSSQPTGAHSRGLRSRLQHPKPGAQAGEHRPGL